MKFFEHQDRARQNTQRLVGLYTLSVISIILSIYGAVLLTSSFVGFKSHRYRTHIQPPQELREENPIAIENYNNRYPAPIQTRGPNDYVLQSAQVRAERLREERAREAQIRAMSSSNTPESGLLQPKLFILSVGAAVLAIGGGSWLKLMSLKQGDSAIAQQLGGRIVLPETAFAPEEQQLLNVVEEMAIAVGVSVPYVYILDSETGINAFAAGYCIDDAVIGVTRGCLEELTRDELQGVIGHEFSHILNGDMRLNIQLIAALHGILMVYLTGRIAIEWGYSRRGWNFLLVLGLLLMIIGSIGHIWGQILQSAVSRQREFLADASSTQFTRNPAGLAGALRKIANKSHILSPYAVETSHLFFGNVIRKSWLGDLGATHPPLKQRLSRLESGGSYSGSNLSTSRSTKNATPASLDRGGTIQPKWLSEVPSLQGAIAQPSSAQSLVYALLLEPEPALQSQQIELISRIGSDSIAENTVKLAHDIKSGLESILI